MAKKSASGGRAQPKGTKSAAQLLKEKKAPTLVMPIPTDSDLVDVLTDAKKRVDELEKKQRGDAMRFKLAGGDGDYVEDPGLAAEIEGARAAVAQAEADLDETSIQFRMRSIGRKPMAALIKLHKPSQEQIDEYQELLRKAGKPTTDVPEYNEDTFPPALMSAACVDPELTPEQAQDIWDGTDGAYSEAEAKAIYFAAIEVNRTVK